MLVGLGVDAVCPGGESTGECATEALACLMYTIESVAHVASLCDWERTLCQKEGMVFDHVTHPHCAAGTSENALWHVRGQQSQDASGPCVQKPETRRER